MGRDAQDKDPSAKADEIEREAEENRKKLDEAPPPGTDPLHEGP